MKPATSVFLLIEDIYKTVGDDKRWTAVLRSFQNILGCAACALARFDFDRRAGDIRHAVGISDRYRAAYRDQFAALNPWLAREECFRREGAVWLGRELAPHRELVTSEFYREWLKPQNLFHASVAVLRWAGAETLYLTAMRPPTAGPFERRELDAYEVYVPHLRQALELAARLDCLQSREAQGLEELVGEAPGTVIVLDAREKVLAASREAEKLLASGEPFRAGRGGLQLAHRGDREPFQEKFAAALRIASGEDVTPGHAMSLHDQAHGQLNTAVIPLPKGAFPGQDRPAVAVVVEDRVPEEARLRELYGLTPAEARVAAHLARGLSVQEAAERLGIGITTARTHLQHIYGKTSTRRQPELVALLLGAAVRPNAD